MNMESISKDEAMVLIQLESDEAIMDLVRKAGKVTRAFNGGQAHLCSIFNAKSGLCQENCAFCAQSLKFKSEVKRYPLADCESSLEKARLAKQRGAQEFCLVTSGGQLTAGELKRLVEIVRRIKEEVAIQVDVSVGFLDEEKALALKEAGVTRVNHNVQTSSCYYPQIATTHFYGDRTATLAAVRKAGLQICSGVILGLGESREDRIQAAFELREFAPECVPINLLDPRPGTPLAVRGLLHPMEIIKTIAVFRLILPKANLRLAGGRHLQLGSFQKLALSAGINGLVVGEYLTTAGSPLEEDYANLEAAGYEF